MSRPKITCPDCGSEMNHHAMKLDHRSETPTLQEVHTCPGCGRIEMRQAE